MGRGAPPRACSAWPIRCAWKTTERVGWPRSARWHRGVLAPGPRRPRHRPERRLPDRSSRAVGVNKCVLYRNMGVSDEVFFLNLGESCGRTRSTDRVWADASKVAPRHSAVTRVVFLAQADIPLQDLLPALLPRGGVCEQSHTCEVLGLLGKTRALDGEDPGAAGAEGGQERPTGRRSAGAVPVERAVSN